MNLSFTRFTIPLNVSTRENNMGLWKNIRGIWNPDVAVEAIIDAQVSAFNRMMHHHPERDQNSWLATTLNCRPKWTGHDDLYCYTQTAMFSLAPTADAPVALGIYIATVEIGNKVGIDFYKPKPWLGKFLEIMNPIENLKAHDLLTRWRTVNPWTSIHFPSIENELPKMTKYAPTSDDLKNLGQLVTLEMKLDGITKRRVEQFTRDIEEKMPNFTPGFWGIIFTHGFALARNTIREEGSFLKGVEKLVEISCQHELENREEMFSARRKLRPITLEMEIDGPLKRRIEDIISETKNAFPDFNEVTEEAFGNILFAGFMSFRKTLSEKGDVMESLKKIASDLMKEEA